MSPYLHSLLDLYVPLIGLVLAFEAKAESVTCVIHDPICKRARDNSASESLTSSRCRPIPLLISKLMKFFIDDLPVGRPCNIPEHN